MKNKKDIMKKRDTDPQSDVTTDDKGNVTIKAPVAFLIARPPIDTPKD